MGKPVKNPELMISAVSFCLLVPIKMLLASLIKTGYLFKGVENRKSHQVWLLVCTALEDLFRASSALSETVGQAAPLLFVSFQVRTSIHTPPKEWHTGT